MILTLAIVAGLVLTLLLLGLCWAASDPDEWDTWEEERNRGYRRW